MKKKAAAEKPAGTTVSNCNFTITPESDEAVTMRVSAIVRIADALKANAESLGKAAEALRGTNNVVSGLRIEQ